MCRAAQLLLHRLAPGRSAHKEVGDRVELLYAEHVPEATYDQRARPLRSVGHRVLQLGGRDDRHDGRDTAARSGQNVTDPVPMTCPLEKQVTVDMRAFEEEPGTAERSQSNTGHAEVTELGSTIQPNEIC